VGVAPRRNPDIAVAVLWEHGNWGNNSAKLAAQVIDAFVTKQRGKAGNLKLAETTGGVGGGGAARQEQEPKKEEAAALPVGQ